MILVIRPTFRDDFNDLYVLLSKDLNDYLNMQEYCYTHTNIGGRAKNNDFSRKSLYL
jgi:hypothetical protein